MELNMNDPMTDQPEYENKPQRSGATPNWVIGGILILICFALSCSISF